MLDGIGNLGYVNAALLFCALVFVHELGHYLVARWNKVTVEVFSIGFGPELVGWVDKAGTRWRLSMIPLGGYVKMLGEQASALEESANNKKADNANPIELISFSTRSIGARAAIIAAGPIANFLFAMVLFAVLFASYGKTTPGTLDNQGIGMVETGGPADQAGLLVGDKILNVNNNPISKFEDLVNTIKQSQGNPLKMEIVRMDSQGNGNSILVNVIPMMVGEDANGVKNYRIGVGAPPPVFEEISLSESVMLGVSETYRISILTLQALWETITGARGTEDLGGPIKIVQLSNDMSQFGLGAFISFAAMLSINLGLINLFPIPVLDGGHLLFLAIEKLRGGRPLDGRWHDYSMRFGLALVLGLMVFVTINDILSFF